MIDVKCDKLAVIQAKTGGEFENAVNEKLLELSQYKPELEIEHNMPFVAYIKYHFFAEYPESISEAMYLKGFRNMCKDCEYCERKMTAKGEPQKNVKFGYCTYHEKQIVLVRDACDKFYLDRITKGIASQPETEIAIEFYGALPDATE